MRPCAFRLCVLAVVAGLAGWSAPARAWTDSSVRTAQARVTLSEDGGSVHVELTAELRVDGGWLQAFELDGLDEGLVLDSATPPTFERWAQPEEAELGAEASALELAPTVPDPVFVEALAPRVSTRGSRVTWAFSRPRAPRRGLYRAHVTYDAPAATLVTRAVDRAELAWTLPAWRNGLDGVEITLVLPPGAAVIPLEESDEGAIEVVETDDGAHVSVSFTRVHLPRTQSWTVRAELPPSFRAAAAPAVDAPAAAAASSASDVAPLGVALATLLVALLAMTQAWARHRAASAAMVASGALVPMPLTARGAVMALLVVAQWALLFEHPLAAELTVVPIALLGAHRASGARRDALQVGSFRSAWGRSVRAARSERARWRRGAWLDGARLPGLGAVALVVGLLGAAVSRQLLGLDVAVLTFAAAALVLVSGGPRPRGPLATLGELLVWAEHLEVALPVALAPLVHVDIRGRVQAARLRISIAGTEEGLVRFDVVLDEHGRPRLVLAARRGSAAERAVLALAAEHGLDAVETPSERTAVDAPVALLGPMARALVAQPPEPIALPRAS
jgi:hypothetical protein